MVQLQLVGKAIKICPWCISRIKSGHVVWFIVLFYVIRKYLAVSEPSRITGNELSQQTTLAYVDNGMEREDARIRWEIQGMRIHTSSFRFFWAHSTF